MSLQVIQGPLNSGRTGAIRAMVEERAQQSPLIVAPTADARHALERELCEEREAIVGPLVTGFLNLAEAVADAAGAEIAPLASAVQRRYLAAVTTRETRLGILAESATRPGFPAALERLFGEMRSSGVRPGMPAVLESGVDGQLLLDADPPDRYLEEVMELYAGYVERLQGFGLTDQPGLVDAAASALKVDPDSWLARPVFMHGFDDLTPDQLRLVAALSGATEVTISLTYEDRQALQARSRLLAELKEIGGIVKEAMPPVPAYTENPLLFHLERNFGEISVPAPPPDSGGLTVLQTAGSRGEAEATAVRVRRLIEAGTPASGIAIALRTPNQLGPLLARALSAAGVPAALETEVPIADTATGQALSDVAEAALRSRSSEALMRLLRGCGTDAISQSGADELERRIRARRLATADEALQALGPGREVRVAEITRLRSAAAAGGESLAREVTAFTRAAAERAGGTLEDRAARQIAATALELSELGATPEDLLDGLGAIEVPTWSGPTGERVRLASPYTLRTSRFSHLFVCSLQDGEFPRRGREGPFLSEAQRARLGMRERADTEAEEMYLFQVCLSLPEQGLWLSARTADANGSPEQPSPYLAQVEALAGDAVERVELGLSAIVAHAEEATSEDELARALAFAIDGSDRPVSPGDDPGPHGDHPVAAALARLELPDDETAARLLDRVAGADERRGLAARPRQLTQAPVLNELGARRDFGATGLEAFLRYPYHWFIGHELRPDALDPSDEFLVDGSLAHAVLQNLYSAPPAADPGVGSANSGDPDTEPQPGAIPRPGSLNAWIRRCDELLEEEARKAGLDRRVVADRIRLRRMTGFLHAFLELEASSEPLGVKPALIEAAFGGDPGESERPSLDRGEWRLRGMIDRVDLTSDGRAGLLQDYKYSTRPRGLPEFEAHGILQLPLYLAALQEIWGIEPLGGLYRPLRARRGTRARGLLSTHAVEGPLEGLDYHAKDVVEDASLKLLIGEALNQADEVVHGIRSGRIDGEPLPEAFTDVPGWAAIDRRERRYEDDET